MAIYFGSASFGINQLTKILSFIESKIIEKIIIHDKIHTLAASFLSRNIDHYSKALDDGNISQQELTMILSEHAKYLELRKAIREKDFHQSDSQDLIKQFRDRIHKST